MPSEKPPALRRAGVTETDDVNDLVDPAARDAMGLGKRQQVVAGRATSVDGAGLEQCADLEQWGSMFPVAATVDDGCARAGRIKADDAAHRG